MNLDNPELSVVMSVYNGVDGLAESIDSILTQSGVALELIVVNDGSTDGSDRILEEHARRDPRVRVIDQQNRGLTRSLIQGCSVARGGYIARQDCGDVSLPGRLSRQLDRLRRDSDCSFVSCGTRFVGPAGERLYDKVQNPEVATARLLTLDPSEITGPSSHPSTLFSRDLYRRVGGYREEFYFAQDLDLWIRFAEQGRHVVVPEILYQAAVSPGTISGLYRKEQVETTRLILESARLRRSGSSDKTVLERARRVRPAQARATSRLARARALYFIGMCLKKQSSPSATAYLKQAFRTCPFHLKSAVRLLLP